MEAELGTAKVRVVAYVDDDTNMTKMELLQMVNDLHDKLTEKAKTKSAIARMVGFGR